MTEAAAPNASSEILFYQLERLPLEKVLPSLLEKTLQRGWRAVVKAGSAERLEALDLALWTYRDDSFLAHGTAKDGFLSEHPVLLTLDDEAPNGARVRFYVDHAVVKDFNSEDVRAMVRSVFVFDGNDEEALGQAREHWKAARAAGHTCSYWQQTASGGWEKKA